jgi:hypothetical protein
MTDTQNSIGNQSIGGATSVQGLFLIHHLMAMQQLQTILTATYEYDTDRWSAFNRQSLYLLSLITDDVQRAKVRDIIDAREKELIINPWYAEASENRYASRLTIITELCRYLSQSMDLIHHDILSSVGSGTSDIVDTPDSSIESVQDSSIIILDEPATIEDVVDANDD